jgi:hypothetical protein
MPDLHYWLWQWRVETHPESTVLNCLSAGSGILRASIRGKESVVDRQQPCHHLRPEHWLRRREVDVLAYETTHQINPFIQPSIRNQKYSHICLLQ